MNAKRVVNRLLEAEPDPSELASEVLVPLTREKLPLSRERLLALTNGGRIYVPTPVFHGNIDVLNDYASEALLGNEAGLEDIDYKDEVFYPEQTLTPPDYALNCCRWMSELPTTGYAVTVSGSVANFIHDYPEDQPAV
jgi:hypothetical protein